MQLDSLSTLVEKEILEISEYNAFLQDSVHPMLNPKGRRHCEELEFFNIGYQCAMQKVRGMLDLIKEQPETPLLTQCSYELVMGIIEVLMSEDPPADSVLGNLLMQLVAAVKIYEGIK